MIQDTIAAPITPLGSGAISVIRISGPLAQEVTSRLLKKAPQILETPKVIVLSELWDLTDGDTKESLDEVLAVFFKGPKSYTGEDTIEISVHGSGYVQRRLLENLWYCGIRPARPGEFTERAFHFGRLDLSQAEAVLDLVNAETQSQAKAAKRQLEGQLSHALSELGEPLRNLLAEIEAHIDFPDEDIHPLEQERWATEIAEVFSRVEKLCLTYREGRLLREGAKIAIVGLPNAGKSSLLNTLLGEERAIVTALPGTTRDSIEEKISLDGLLVRLCDTAGLELEFCEKTRRVDLVERLGMERSWKLAREAELTLFVLDINESVETQKALFFKVQEISEKIIVVANKVDLVASAELSMKLRDIQQILKHSAVAVSTETKFGVEPLREQVRGLLLDNEQSTAVVVTTERHFLALSSASRALQRAIEACRKSEPAELVSVDIRESLGALSDIVGVTHTEDILGRIFSKFCIGK